MIVTLTPNTGLDLVIFVDRFAWGETVRATDAVLAMGGKGTDVSVVLGILGVPNLALGFAAGPSGQRMVQMLQARGVTCDFVWTEGETRTNVVLVDREKGRQSTITTPGVIVGLAHIEALWAKLRAIWPRASCLMLGGSLPQGVEPAWFGEVIAEAREVGIPVLFDASGAGLRAGVQALPDLLKVNRAELEQLVGQPLPTEEAIRCAARSWLAQGIRHIVTTSGAQGAWAFSQSESYFIPPLIIPAVNTAGAGDGLMAGLAMGLAQGWDWAEALRMGTAIAAAVCLTPGTADCRREDVERLMPQVQIIPLQT